MAVWNFVGLVVALGLGGCDSTPSFDPPGWWRPVYECEPTDPGGTLCRLREAYQYQDLTHYRAVLTADFRFAFSSQSDPALVALYGATWGKDDETEAAQHLLTGFTNTQGTYVRPASSIVLRFVNAQLYTDPAHADSARYFAYCPVDSVNLTVDVPDTSGSTRYSVSAPMNFHLVRGDAAVLDAGQPADSLHWYIHRCDDLAPAALVQGPAGSIATTWGRLKARYRG